jgi:hypothetical protein
MFEQEAIALLRRIAENLEAARTKLGFQESTVVPVYVNATRCSGFLWYRVLDGTNVGIKASAFTGYVSRITKVVVQRMEEDADKLHVYIEGDDSILYRFECGWKSQTAKSILSAIAILSVEQLKLPITLRPELGKKQTVFMRVYSGGKRAYAPYDKTTDFDLILEEFTEKLTALAPVTPEEAESIPSSDGEDGATAPKDAIAPAVESQPPGIIDRINQALKKASTLDQLIQLAIWFNAPRQMEHLKEVPTSHGYVVQQLSQRCDSIVSDISDVLSQIDVELERLQWTADTGRQHLKAVYGKTSRQLLNSGQLLDFLGYLRNQNQSLLPNL